METLQQIFMTIIAAFVFFILIAKIASGITNGGGDDHRRKRIHDFSKVLAEELNSKTEKSSTKKKSMKKVRFAVDHDGILVNKVVAGPSETKRVVFENNNHNEELINLNEVESIGKTPEEEFGGVEKANYDDNKPRAEAVTSIVDYDQTKEGNTDSVDQKSSQGTMISDQKNHHEEMINLNDVGSAVKSPGEEFGGVENADYDDSNPRPESVNPSVVDYGQTKQVNAELIDQKSTEATIIPDQNAAIDNKHRMCMKLLCDDGIDESEKEKEGLISEEEDSDDDWEGVEQSDLEKVFAMAADYGKEDANLQGLGSDIQMQLYGLHKVATEGPCHEAQPMALKLSARSKCDGGGYYARNAWQKLGNMDPDAAMEQYITLLSEKVPGWSQGIHSLGADFSSSSTTSTLGTSQKESKSEMESCCDADDLVGV